MKPSRLLAGVHGRIIELDGDYGYEGFLRH